MAHLLIFSLHFHLQFLSCDHCPIFWFSPFTFTCIICLAITAPTLWFPCSLPRPISVWWSPSNLLIFPLHFHLQFLSHNHRPTFPFNLRRWFLQIKLPSCSIDSPDLGISLNCQTASGDCLGDCLFACLRDFHGFIPFPRRYLHQFNHFQKEYSSYT